MMTGFEQYTRKTRRAIFLEEMEQVEIHQRAHREQLGGILLQSAKA